MKKLLAAFLSVILLLSLLPPTVFADNSSYFNEDADNLINNTGIERTTLEEQIDNQLTAPTDRYENIGIGAGGSFFLPMVDPNNSNNYYVICDMGGLYFTYDRGNSWHRTETRGVFNEACVADDGTIFGGGYGLYTSTDHGQTLELIYPQNVKYSVNRCGWNENLMLADNFDNGYLVGVTTSDDRVWFATIDWSGNFRLMSADYDGNNLELLHTTQLNVSSPMSINLSMVAEENGLFFTLDNKLYCYSFTTKAVSVLYTAKGKLLDLKKIDDYFFLLDDTIYGTKILYTKDFASWQDLMDKNDLPNTFEEWGTTYTFQWHFKEISGNNFQNIFLSFTSDVSDGIMKFNGKTFEWAFDSMYNSRYTLSDLGWGYGCHGPFYGICADPNNDDLCIVSNIETVYTVHYGGGDDREIRTTHCISHDDGTYTTTGLNVQTTYSVQEDPFNPDHIIICTTDMGLQNSYDNGKSFKRMTITGNNWDIYNTCYDLYFDRNKQDLVYGLWSNRHDAPYDPYTSDKDWTQGAFAVSNDGGNTWDFSYSTGLPADCIPVKMSIAENGDELTIAVATFNRGFFISYDSGKTFTSISSAMETVEGLIWGEDVVLVDNTVYCLTAPYNCITGSWETSKLYAYDLLTGKTKDIDLGDLVMVRSLTYNEDTGLYLNVIPTYHYEWFSELNGSSFVNDNGGVYHYDGESIQCVFANNDGIFNSGFAPDGTMYAVDPYGKIFAGKDGYFSCFADEMFIMLKNVSFSSDGDTMYVTTFGGGTYRLSIPAPEPDEEEPDSCNHVAEIRNKQDATCTSEGYTGDTYCSICDTLISKGNVISKKSHSSEIHNYKIATCTSEGYTGDTYCSVCDTLISKGNIISMLNHTTGTVSNNNATHSEVCATCKTNVSTAPCQDKDDNGSCDICSYRLRQDPTFLTKSTVTSGNTYLIIGSNKVLNLNLRGTALTMKLESGVYTPSTSITDEQLWTYQDGKLYCEVDGVRHYLTTNANGSLTTTTDSSAASKWNSSNNRLSTTVTQSSGSKKKNTTKTYYLSISGSTFTLSENKTKFNLYEMQ